MGINEALIQSFIPAANQDSAFTLGPFFNARMVQCLANGCKQNHRYRLFKKVLECPVLSNGQQTFFERLGQHDHAWAAAERAIVHTAVSAIGVITELPQFEFDSARFKGTSVDA